MSAFTVQQFATSCKDLSSDEIYELFEDNTAENLQERILAFADFNTPEPVRSAINNLGKHCDVQSMIDY